MLLLGRFVEQATDASMQRNCQFVAGFVVKIMQVEHTHAR